MLNAVRRAVAVARAASSPPAGGLARRGVRASLIVVAALLLGAVAAGPAAAQTAAAPAAGDTLSGGGSSDASYYTSEVREFLQWFAEFQKADGNIPCCIDQRGADWVAEHDSDGQFIYAVAEYYRYTRDVGFLSEMWPHVVQAVAYLESVLNVHHIVITGSVARFGQALIGPIKQQVNEGFLPALTHETQIETSELGQDIVILGAAALLLSQEMALS